MMEVKDNNNNEIPIAIDIIYLFFKYLLFFYLAYI